MEASRNPSSTALEPDRPKHDLLISYVISQQYSSATFLSLRFQFRKKKFGALL
jgi:hypothetical protein